LHGGFLLLNAFGQSMLPLFEASVASGLRTSDWDKPNCRAMRPGVMPTLKAARTAFSCPRVNETGASAVRLIRKCFAVSVVSLPRLFASANVTASTRSNSSSLRCFSRRRHHHHGVVAVHRARGISARRAGPRDRTHARECRSSQASRAGCLLCDALESRPRLPNGTLR
jgi:hypothetical protein